MIRRNFIGIVVLVPGMFDMRGETRLGFVVILLRELSGIVVALAVYVSLCFWVYCQWSRVCCCVCGRQCLRVLRCEGVLLAVLAVPVSWCRCCRCCLKHSREDWSD